MKRILAGLLSLILGACTMTQISPLPAPQSAGSLPDLGPAPELTNDTWLNVDSPLRLADLQGKVVALEMWTFG